MITEGQWEIDPMAKKDVIIRQEDGFIIMRIPCKREDNARLIAAAPETKRQRDNLLATLEQIV